MMKTILKIFLQGILGIAMCICGLTARAQDIHFSQFYESPLTLNPALCGMFNGTLQAEANYRTQWAGAMGAGDGYNTIGASVEYQNLSKDWKHGYLSAGLSFFNDRSGALQIDMNQVNLSIASGVFLNRRSCLTGGLQAGWSQHSINLQNIPWDEQYINGQYDPNASSGEPSMGNTFSYLDFSAGMLYSYIVRQATLSSNDHFKLNLGAAIFHVNQPEMSYYNMTGPGTNLYMRFVFHASADYGIPNSPLSVVPALIFFRQGPAQEIDAGAMVRYVLRQQSQYTGNNKGTTISAGAYYRWDDAAIIMIQMDLVSYSFGLSYDVNISQYTSATSGAGALEISLKYILGSPLLGNSANSHSMF